jgi:putative addiction module antidote
MGGDIPFIHPPGAHAMTAVKVTTVGNSVGIVLPKELLERLRINKGDMLQVIETPDGVELTPYKEEFAQQMDVAERVMRQDRDVLRKLAE